MPLNEVKGRVLRLRRVGGIVFLVVFSGNEQLSLVCDRKRVGSGEFTRFCRLRRGDYARVRIEYHGQDVCALQLILHHQCMGQPQTDLQLAMMRAYASMLSLVRDHLTTIGYLEVRLPSIHFGSTKGDKFMLSFFGQPARLSKSNALFADACAMRLCRIYSIQRCFRAEKSHTRKHLSEFDMLEVAILDATLDAGMSIVESLIAVVVRGLQESEFARFLRNNIEQEISIPFTRKSYESVVGPLGIQGQGLGRFEQLIAAEAPVFVYGFPTNIASWTSEQLADGSTASFNLLLPGVGEVAEGTQRVHNVEQLRIKFQALRITEQLDWYVDSIAYPHARTTGFGLGLERLAMWLFDLKNIRQVQPFYRDTTFSEISLTKRSTKS